jgi:hypothetical protein
MVNGTDNIIIPTLLLNPGAEFTTNASVFTSTNPSTAAFYEVHSLDVITDVIWYTECVFAPDTDPTDDFIRFDTRDILPNQTILTFNGSNGMVDLGEFDPMTQHETYLGVRPLYADDPGYRDTAEPGFLISPYQTKRLDLENVTLLDQTVVNSIDTNIADPGPDGNLHYRSNNSAYGDLYDDFAFTAGLRRYYWDVYVDSQQADNPLIAHNYFTADASKVYAQSAGAALVSVNQNLQVTMGAIEKIDAVGPMDKVYINAVIGGSTSKTQTGSHVEVDNRSVALTISKKTSNGIGQTTLGLFGEYGEGNYDTYSNIPRYGEVFGSGEVTNFGGGFFYKSLFKQNTVIEASIRGGGIKNDYSLTKDPWIRNAGVHSYSTDNNYYGAHFGLGQRFNISEGSNLEGYGRFFWTRTNSDDFVTRFGDDVEIDKVDSSRGRVGARFNQNIANNTVKFYIGAAAEHEFDGKITGRLGPDPISNPPEVKGTSGFGELGLTIMPTDSKNISINAEVFGWTGRQEGIGGSAALSFNF